MVKFGLIKLLDCLFLGCPHFKDFIPLPILQKLVTLVTLVTSLSHPNKNSWFEIPVRIKCDRFITEQIPSIHNYSAQSRAPLMPLKTELSTAIKWNLNYSTEHSLRRSYYPSSERTAALVPE